MKYYTYSAVLGKLRDDGILSEHEIKELSKHHLESNPLDGIKIQLSNSKAKKVWEVLEINFSEFLKEFRRKFN